MIWIIVLLFLVVIVALFCKFIMKKNDGNEVWPYYQKKVLSQPEQILFYRISNALPEYIVLAQVQMSRFVDVKKSNNYQKWYNKINLLSVDYLICRKDFSIVAVVELDDSSHSNEKRKLVDSKKDRVLETIGIKIVRWNVKLMPDDDTIKMVIDGKK